MKVLIVDNNTQHLGEISELLHGHTIEVIAARELDPRLADHYDLVVLSGGRGRAVVDNRTYLQKERKLIAQTKTPVIGICLGAELIADVFGAKLHRMLFRRRWHIPIFFVQQSSIRPNEPELKVYEAHHWAITDLPEELECLATSKDGIEVFRHKKRPIFGLQFHPEVAYKYDHGARIFKKIIKLCSQ